jgi:hypothetical protein
VRSSIERQVEILRRLYATRPSGLERNDLWRRLHHEDFYSDSDAGNRMFTRDLEALRDRGLVRSEPKAGQTVYRGTRLGEKPGDLKLSPAELEAVVEAGDRVAPRRSTASPSSDEAGTQPGKLDDALRAARFVEERRGEATISDVAAYLGRDPRTVVSWLFLLEGDMTRSSGASQQLELHYDDSGQPKRVTVRIGARPEGVSELEGAFLDELGFFPYSQAEIEDRLEVIALALEDPTLPPADQELLWSARQKLSNWRHVLGTQEMS